MCLSTKGLVTALGILCEDQTKTRLFETLCNKFHHCFKKEDKFKVGNTLLFLMQQQDILSLPIQRLTAVVLLHDPYSRDPIVITPFSSVFIQILEKEEFRQRYMASDPDDKDNKLDEISVFYKEFLDRNWNAHYHYNFQWYKKNIYLSSLALRVHK